MIELAITLGLVFSLLSYEVFGLAAGGIVVPGYIALQLSHPDRLAGIIGVSLLTKPETEKAEQFIKKAGMV